MQALWFSVYDFSNNYKDTMPSFIDAKPFDWASDLKQRAEDIKQELANYLEQQQLQSYFNASMVSKQNSWKTVSLKTWDVNLFKNQLHFPITTSLLNKYPQIVSASFNLLEPQAHILPHCGDTNAIYRCHLGIDIPAELPECGFRVNNEKQAWHNNEWLIFLDAYNHEAWNNSSKARYIFLIDVMREEFVTEQQKVCSTVLTSLFMQKHFNPFKNALLQRPQLVTLIAKSLRPFASLALRMSNYIKLF